MALTSIDAIKNKLSSAGVTLRLDDDPAPPGTDDADILEEADEIIYEHTIERYTETTLAASSWVARAACLVATVLLCQRRGNPPPASLYSEYERYMERLEQCRLCRFNIPRASMREACVPRLINQRPVLRPNPRMVTEKRKSTGIITDYRQKGDPAEKYMPHTLDYII